METIITQTESPMETTQKQVSLNQILQENPALQSQFDQLITKAINTAKSNWAKDQGQLVQSDVEAQMSVKVKTLVARENALSMRERRAEAMDLLAERGLPIALVDCLNLQDDESMMQSVQKMGELFLQSVEQAVQERLCSTAPKQVQTSTTPYLSQMRKVMGLK